MTGAADRQGLRYPSDLSDREWALIEPAIPPAKFGGRRRLMRGRNSPTTAIPSDLRQARAGPEQSTKSAADYQDGVYPWPGKAVRFTSGESHQLLRLDF